MTVGEMLKNERERKGLSLHEIGIVLKIHPKILSAIENSEQQHLPAKTFLRGFVKSYATHLKLDIAAVMEAFSQQYDSSHNKNTATSPLSITSDGDLNKSAAPESSDASVASQNSSSNEQSIHSTVTNLSSSNKSSFNYKNENNQLSEKIAKTKDSAQLSESPKKKVRFAFWGIFLVSAFIILIKLVEKYQKESHIFPDVLKTELKKDEDTSQDESNSEAPAIIEPESEDKTKENRVSETPPDNTSSIEKNKLENKNLGIIKNPIKSPVPHSVSLQQPNPAAPQPNPVASQPNSATQLPNPAAPQPNPSTNSLPIPSKLNVVIVEALEPVNIKYFFEKDYPHFISLPKGGTHTFRSEKYLKVEIEDGGNSTVIINGLDKGVPTEKGHPYTFEAKE